MAIGCPTRFGIDNDPPSALDRLHDRLRKQFIDTGGHDHDVTVPRAEYVEMVDELRSRCVTMRVFKPETPERGAACVLLNSYDGEVRVYWEGWDKP